METKAKGISGQDPSSLNGLRTVLFLILLMFLNLQSDGLPLGHNQAHRQLLLIPFTVLFCVGLCWTLWPGAVARRICEHWFEKFSGWRAILVVAMVLLILAAVLFCADSRYYAVMGYQLHKVATGLVFGGALFLLASNFRRIGTSDGGYLIGTVMIAYVAVYLLSIWSFPINVWRSDMLPLLSEAGKTLLAGQNPYRLYTFPNETLFLTYLPGTVLAFTPAVLMHLDLRFADIVYVVTLAVLVYSATMIQYRREAAALLGVFLLSPYLQYRHEIYTEPHWLSIVACMLLAQRGRLIWAAVVFGISISLSQFSWVLLPFFLLFLFQQRGLHTALQAGVISLVAGAAIVGPFVGWSPRAFAYGVLTHWQTVSPTARSINFSYWMGAVVGLRHLQIVQFIVLLGIFVFCAVTKSCSNLTGALRWMSISLASFIMLNPIVWGYFFLLLEMMVLLYVMSANGWLKGDESLAVSEGRDH